MALRTIIMKQIPALLNLIVAVVAGLCVHAAGAQLTIAQEVERSVVMLAHRYPANTNVLGTGFVVSTNGVVATADHVIYDEKRGVTYKRIFAIWNAKDGLIAREMKVIHRFKNGTKGRDLALLRPVASAGLSLECLKIGGNAAVGNEIILAGFPLVFDSVKMHPLVRRGSIASTKYQMDGDEILVRHAQRTRIQRFACR